MKIRRVVKREAVANEGRRKQQSNSGVQEPERLLIIIASSYLSLVPVRGKRNSNNNTVLSVKLCATQH